MSRFVYLGLPSLKWCVRGAYDDPLAPYAAAMRVASSGENGVEPGRLSFITNNN